jgi:hypothetical protein
MRTFHSQITLTGEYIYLSPEYAAKAVAKAGADLLYKALMDPNAQPCVYMSLDARHHDNKFTMTKVVDIQLIVAERTDQPAAIEHHRLSLEPERMAALARR